MDDPKKKFAKLYDKYVIKLYRFIFLKVGSQETAEDLTSQVFAKVWDRFRNSNRNSNRKKEEIKNLTAYLYQVARREIANYHRQKAKFQVIPTHSLQLSDPASSLEENSTLQEEIEAVRNSLSELTEDHQNVIIWRYLDGYSIKEIAKILGKSKGAVRVMLHRALKELREKVERL